MNEELEFIDRTLAAIFAKHAGRDARAADAGAFPSRLWSVLDEAGMTSVGDVDNDAGTGPLAVIARAVGRSAAAVPLVEMAGLASWVLSAAGIPVPQGITTSTSTHRDDVLDLSREASGWRVRGALHRVPWGRDAAHVAAVATHDGSPYAVLLPVDLVAPGTNLAGEPRDTLRFDTIVAPDAVAPSPVTLAALRRRGAVLRSASMAGAMDSARDLSLTYADEREQFGQRISTFQAVQHHLVAIAEETLCAAMAVQLAVAADDTDFSAGSAKVTAGNAAAVVSRRAHQVHAAIGVTQEHALPWFTTRMWAWQDEFGSTREWSLAVGQAAVAAGGAALWPTIGATVGAARSSDRAGVPA